MPKLIYNIHKKEKIHILLTKYLCSNNYRISNKKSKNFYALDSIVAEYVDTKGNVDNIKIEINYMNRIHILETKKIKTAIFEDSNFEIHCVNPIEIYASKICALLSRTTARDLYNIYVLSKNDLFTIEEKKILKQCFILEYIAINDYKINDMKIEKIDKLKKQDIKTKLLPTLKNRNYKNSDIDEMKQSVKKYLNSILELDEKAKEFYEKFQMGAYEPELLFDDIEILNRVNKHPMILWKLKPM